MQVLTPEISKKVQVIKISPSVMYKEKVAAVKDRLPSNYVDIINNHYPEYDSAKGYNLIKNVKSLKTADVMLTEIFENIANGKLTL